MVEGESIKLLVKRSASKEEEMPPKERLLPTKGKKRRGEEEGRRGGGGNDIPPPPKTSGASKFSERELSDLIGWTITIIISNIYNKIFKRTLLLQAANFYYYILYIIYIYNENYG